MLSALLVGLALVAADPAVTPPVSAPVAKGAATAPDSDRLVCRKETKPNSRFTTRICMTAADWEKRTEQARKDFADLQNRPMINGGKSN